MELRNPPTPLNFKKKYWYSCKQCRHTGYTNNVDGACSKCHKKFTTTKTKINFNPHYVGTVKSKHEVTPAKETLKEENKVIKQEEVVNNDHTEYLGQPTPLTQHEIDLGFVETHTIHVDGEVIDTDNELMSTIEDDDTDETRKIVPADNEEEQLSSAREKEVREQLKVLAQIQRYNERQWRCSTQWGTIYLIVLLLIFAIVAVTFITIITS